MANFHFFTEIDLLNKQLDTEAFGPLKGFEATQYRVTSLHTASSNPKAYAVCAGEIQIQEIPNTELVNIILKPSEQGIVDGIKVKYFIYRGILKNTLIDSDSREIVDKSKSKLVENIWKYQDVCNSLSAKVGNPSIDILLKTGDAYLNLQDLYKIKTDFVSPCVEQGDHIGIFDKDKIGFEIVVDSITLTEPISIAQTLEHIIEVTENATPPTYAEKAKREQILNYIDPAAYYGMHYYSGIKRANDTKIIKENDLYTSIILKAFYNHNVTYIDIRHETGFSYVYYGDYTVNLEDFDLGITSTDNTTYSTNKWPIYIHRSIEDIFSEIDGLYVQFKLALNEESYPLICVLCGFIFENQNVNTNPQGKNKFILTKQLNVLETYCRLNFSIKTIAVPYSLKAKNIVSSYTKLLYIKKTHKVFESNHYIDNLFPITEPIRNFTEEKVEIKHIGYERYVNEQDKILALNEKHILFSNGIYDSCIAFDKNRVTLFAVPKHYHNISGIYHIPETFNDCTVNSKSYLHYTQEKLQGYKLVKCNITSGIQIITLKEELFAEKWEEKFEDQIAIIISKTQYQELLDKISMYFNTTYHPVFLQRVFVDGATQEDLKNESQKQYKKITLKLAGLDNNGNYKNDVDTYIDIYSVDGFIYCSPLNTNEYDDIDIIEIQDFVEGDISIEFSDSLLNNSKLNDIMSVVKDTKFFYNWVKKTFNLSNVFKIKFGLLDYSATRNAVTTPPGYEGYPLDAITIEFYSNYIENAKDISIVRTLYHELMHAYFDAILFNVGVYYISEGNAYINIGKLGYLKEKYFGFWDFINRFSKKDDDGNIIDIAYDGPEKTPQHNIMSFSFRSQIIEGMMEFDNLLNMTELERSGEFSFVNILDNTIIDNKKFNKNDLYVSLSWAGLFSTRQWREFARKDKITAQFYFLIYVFYASGCLELNDGNKGYQFPFNNPVDSGKYLSLNIEMLDRI